MLSRTLAFVSTVGLAAQVILGILAFPFVYSAVKAHQASTAHYSKVAESVGL